MLKARICFYIAGICCSNDFDAAYHRLSHFSCGFGCSARLY